MIARYSLADRELWGVTATLNGEFVGSVNIGDRVEGSGEVVKAGGSLIFVRGTITVEAEPVMVFSGVIKRIKPRT
jgi:acyl-coenzyme A thioesterase PaaI-like protein